MQSESQRSFLEEVLAHPDDDTPRLIYADWLEESGDPRGAFIRAQCHLAQTDIFDPAYYQWLEISRQLHFDHGATWAEEINQDVKKAKFRRGFIDEVTVLASALIKEKGAIFAHAPIDWLRLNRVKGKGAQIAELELLTRMRGLDISGIKIPTDDLVAIFESPHLTNLKGLKTIAYNSEFGPHETKSLSESKAAETLTELELVSLGSNMSAFASGQGYPELKRLAIRAYHDHHDEEPLAAMAEVQAPKLGELSLKTRLRPGDLKELRHIPWGSIKTLSLNECSLEPGVIPELVETGVLQTVEVLDLDYCPMPEDEVPLLFQGDQLKNCRELTLQLVTDEIAMALMETISIARSQDLAQQLPMDVNVIQSVANHQPLSNLKHLSLVNLPTGGLTRLFEAGHLNHLEGLSLRYSQLSESDVMAITKSNLVESLKRLEIAGTSITGEGLNHLESVQFPNLVHLHFGGGYEGLSRLRNSEIERLLSANTFSRIKSLNLDWCSVALEILADSANLPDLRLLSQCNVRATQRGVKAFFEADRFPKLIQLTMTGSFPAKITEKLNKMFGYRFEM